MYSMIEHKPFMFTAAALSVEFEMAEFSIFTSLSLSLSILNKLRTSSSLELHDNSANPSISSK